MLRMRTFTVSLLLAPVLWFAAVSAHAVTPTPQLPIPPAPSLPNVASYVVLDYQTGQVVASKDPDLRRAPASLTKLMTAYLTYQAIAGGSLRLDESVPVTQTAWKTGGSRMFLQPQLPVTVDQLLHGLLIDSGNDAAVALAENVGGSQSAFVTLMNDAAARLQLHSTHYSNVDGLPDDNLYTTAADVSRLSRDLIQQYPQVLQITKLQSYTYNKITQRSWNPVLFRDPSVDGLKTGLTDASGHCIDATALRNGRRLIAVEMGAPSWSSGTDAIEALLNYGYRFYQNRELYPAGKQVGMASHTDWSPMQVPVKVAQAVVVTIPRNREGDIQTRVLWDPKVQPPFAQGAVLGQLELSIDGKVLRNVPVIATERVRKASWLDRLWHRVRAAI
ncbi:D-alanyl-D-alanine carboxypeptidase family protein [Acidithiobacillus acidisediminis]|uniref:D-alanyl-D-alanine carboxypeptidase family protein n=2 Tax=Acidithiobacillus TaxID=119977 RepID=UPI00200BD426|nr:D-alanyl-D-alanine carboxypeptidase family protein [Acidithiobacillus sp. S30A2]